jgi:RNA polymerase sigma-70 factor (ECF subfamily)
LWCKRQGLQDADIEDVGQEVFEVVYRKLGEFHRDQAGDTFRGWLYRVTANKICDRHRKERPGTVGVGGSDALTQLVQMPGAAPGPPDAGSGAEDLQMERRVLIRRALKQLELHFQPQTWQAFMRVSVEGQEAAGVAVDLGIRVEAVYTANSRVRRRLREEFADLVDLGPTDENGQAAAEDRQ